MTIEDGGPLRPGPTAPDAGPRQPRRASGVRVRVRRVEDRAGPRSGWRPFASRTTVSNWPKSTSGCAVPAACSACSNTAWPAFHIADLVRDADVLAEARRDAQTLVFDGSLLTRSEFARLRQMVTRRYGQALELADAG